MHNIAQLTNMYMYQATSGDVQSSCDGVKLILLRDRHGIK